MLKKLFGKVLANTGTQKSRREQTSTDLFDDTEGVAFEGSTSAGNRGARIIKKVKV